LFYLGGFFKNSIRNTPIGETKSAVVMLWRDKGGREMKKNVQYKDVINILVKAILMHMVVELVGGAVGLSFGKWIFEFVSGRNVESDLVSGVASVFVSAIFPVVIKRRKRGKNKFP